MPRAELTAVMVVFLSVVSCRDRGPSSPTPDATVLPVTKAEPSPNPLSVAEASNDLGFRVLAQLPEAENAVVAPLLLASVLLADAEFIGPDALEALSARSFAGRAGDELSRGTKGLLESFLRHAASTANKLRLERPSTNAVESSVTEVSFEGHWQERFDRDRTRSAPFQATPDAAIEVPFMVRTGRMMHFETDDYSIVELPYQTERFSMLVWLPKGQLAVSDLVDRLARAAERRVIDRLALRALDLALPRFSLRLETNLAKALEAAGTTAPPAASGASASVKAWVQRVEFVVDEDGNEAAPQAGKVVGARAIGPPPLVLRIDRPFVFAVRDRPSGAMVILGRVGSLAP